MIVSRSTDTQSITVDRIEGHALYGGELQVKPLLKGDTMAFMEIHYKAGVGAPLHTHSHESLAYIVSGRVKMTVGDETFELGPGDVCRHPAGVPHGVEALQASVMIEIKSPAPDLGGIFSIKDTMNTT